MKNPRNHNASRRTVLKAAAGLAAARPALAAQTAPEALRMKLHPDGTFDIQVGALALRGGYPALDDVPLRPTAVSVEAQPGGGTIRYQLPHGRVVLQLGQDEDGVFIATRLEGFARAPHWVYPLAGARVEGADRFFRQGLGFGGPSGLFPLPRAGFRHDANHLVEQAFSHDSFLTAALVAPSGVSLIIGALEHHDYLQRTTFYNHTHRRELVDKRPASDQLLVEAGFSTERIAVPSSGLELPRLHLLAGAEPVATLTRLAKKIAAHNKVTLRHPPRFHWDSWYEFYEGHDGARLDDTLAGLAAVKPPVPFQGVLIDAGYSPLGDWLIADERIYPGGLEATIKRIQAAGHPPGLWVSPFMVSSNSQLYKKHPDWVVHDNDGKPLLHGEGKAFFYTYANHERRYYLDSSHPEAFAHLREVFRSYRRWGVKSYKLDFLEWGFKDSTTVRRHGPAKTSVQHFVDVVRLIREEIGPDAFFLACIAPFAPCIGFADGMRVGYDVDTDTWRPDGNTLNMFQETQASQYLNGVLWQNDPDVLYVRDGTGVIRMDDDEVLAVALWNGMLGGVVSTSDRPHRLTQERLTLLRFVQPGRQHRHARFPLWASTQAESVRVMVRDYQDHGAHAVLVMNIGEDKISRSFSLPELGVPAPAFFYRWQVGRAARLGRLPRLQVDLGRHQSALFWLSRRDAPPPADLGLHGDPVAGLSTRS